MLAVRLTKIPIKHKCTCVFCSRLCREPFKAGWDPLLQDPGERHGPGDQTAAWQRHERKQQSQRVSYMSHSHTKKSFLLSYLNVDCSPHNTDIIPHLMRPVCISVRIIKYKFMLRSSIRLKVFLTHMSVTKIIMQLSTTGWDAQIKDAANLYRAKPGQQTRL